MEWNSASSNKKASWPLSVFISIKLELAFMDLSAERIVLVSDVGNNQSDEKVKKQ